MDSFNPPKRSLRTGAFVVSLACTSCAAPPTVPINAVSVGISMNTFQNTPCCIPLHSITADPIKGISEPQDVWFGTNKQRINTPLGASYYYAIRLPDQLETFHFGVESFAYSAEGTRQIAVPIVQVLNEDFTISRWSTIEMLEYWRAHPQGLWGERERLSLFVRVDRKTNPRERYVLITTPERTHGRLVSFTKTMGGGISVIPLGATTAIVPNPVQQIRQELVSSPEGEIRILNRSSAMTKPFDRFVYF